MIRVLCLLVLALASPAFAQLQSRPTDPPLVSAAGQSWYQSREPLVMGGDAYYPAGAAVFFNGHVMVRMGHYDGVPVYADATLEPHSVLFVPIGRGLVQPYERPRRGTLAGSVGSRLSGFPVRLLGDASLPMTATAPTGLPYSLGAIVSFTPESRPGLDSVTTAEPVVEVMSSRQEVPAFVAKEIISPRRAESNDGVWVQYQNQRWVSGGRAEVRSSDLREVGTHQGFPVLRRAGTGDDVIYLPAREGLVTPYRRKG